MINQNDSESTSDEADIALNVQAKMQSAINTTQQFYISKAKLEQNAELTEKQLFTYIIEGTLYAHTPGLDIFFKNLEDAYNQITTYINYIERLTNVKINREQVAKLKIIKDDIQEIYEAMKENYGFLYNNFK